MYQQSTGGFYVRLLKISNGSPSLRMIYVYIKLQSNEVNYIQGSARIRFKSRGIPPFSTWRSGQKLVRREVGLRAQHPWSSKARMGWPWGLELSKARMGWPWGLELSKVRMGWPWGLELSKVRMGWPWGLELSALDPARSEWADCGA